VEAVRLWCFDPVTRKLSKATGPVATNTITALAAVGDELWLATPESGIVAWNPETGQLRRYGVESGASTNQI
jgi:hypothetical protein